MAVYLDLVMGLNFGVDFLLLLGSNRLSGFPNGWKRCALAAALGAIYSGACLLPGFRFLGNLSWRVVCLSLMGGIAFGLDRSAIKRTGMFLLLSFAMGGCATGFGRNDFGMLLLSAGIICLLCRICVGTGAGARRFVPVVIHQGDVSVAVTALRDTGNTLRDPITGEQVLILGPEEAEKLIGLSPSQLRKPMETMMERPIPGLRLVPFAAIGQPAGMLLAKRMEKVQVGSWRGSALVAFAPDRIGNGESYRALTGGAVG